MAGGDPDRQKGLGETARVMHGAMPWIAAVWRFVGGAVVGVLAGFYLDRWLGTTPWLLVALTTVGICVGFYGFIHTVMKLGKRG